MNTLEFLSSLYQYADRGHVQIFTLPSAKGYPVPVADLSPVPQILANISAGENIYFSPGLSDQPKSDKLKTEDIIGLPALWVDIDIAAPGAHKKQNLPASIEEAMTLLPEGLPPSVIVFSGYGLHAWWMFREVWYFDTPDEQKRAADILIRLQGHIRQMAIASGWHIDSTTNLDRVMRLPGTLNYKKQDQPIMAQVIEHCDIRYNPDDISEMLPEYDAATGQRIRRTGFERRPSDGPAAMMLSNCVYMTHVQLNAKTLVYGEWLAALTNLVRASDGIEVAHTISALDTDRYDQQKTDKKIDECLAAMHPQTCEYIRRELGFQGCPEGGCGVQAPCGWSLAKVPQARATLRSIAVPTPDNVYSKSVLGALAVVQKESPSDFDQFLYKCKGSGINLNTLKAETKKSKAAAAGLTVLDGGDQPEQTEQDVETVIYGKWLAETVEDVPLNLRMPRKSNTEAWSFQKNGVKLQRATNSGESFHRASYVPILITERIYNVDSQQEKARIAFLTRHGWRSLLLPKSTIFSSKGIMCLANSGLTLNEDCAKYLARWLSTIEAANADIIPEKHGVSKLGWRNKEAEFVLPCMTSSYTLDTGPESDGILSSIYPTGDMAAWISAMAHLRTKFRARFILAASFAAPLLKIVGQRTFLIHNWGSTTDGKTATLQAALSVWGNPNDLMLTFDNTKTSLEKMAEFFTDLPLGINEYEVTNNRRNPDNIDSLVYMVSEGKGRGRANKDGTRQRAAVWRTIAITNGESPITRSSSKGGVITRVIELHGGPLKGDEVFASDLYRILSRHHGHAGPMFVQNLLASNHEALTELYSKLRYSMREAHPGSLESHVDAVSCVVLADYLASQWLFGVSEPEAGQQSIQMGTAVLGELVSKIDASESVRAWDWLIDWIAANENRFERIEGTNRNPPSMVLGYTDGFDTIHIIKSELSKALREEGYSAEKLYRQWADEGKIPSTTRPDGRRDYGTKNKRFRGSIPWVITITT